MKCTYKNTDKSQCQANSMKNCSFCFTHNPETKEAHLKAASKGGLAIQDQGIKLPTLNIKKIGDVTVLLEDTINRVRVVNEDGSMDLKVANCVGYLSGILIKAIEVSDIESRLEVIERVIIERKSLTRK